MTESASRFPWQDGSNIILVEDTEPVPACHRELLRNAYSVPGWAIVFSSDLELRYPREWRVKPQVGRRLFLRYQLFREERGLGRTLMVGAHLFATRPVTELLAELDKESGALCCAGASASPKAGGRGEFVPLREMRLLHIRHEEWARQPARESLLELAISDFDAVTAWGPPQLAEWPEAWRPARPREPLASGAEVEEAPGFIDLWPYPHRPWLRDRAPASNLWLAKLVELVTDGRVAMDLVRQDAEAQLLRPSARWVLENLVAVENPAPAARSLVRSDQALRNVRSRMPMELLWLDRALLFPDWSPEQGQLDRLKAKSFLQRINEMRVLASRYAIVQTPDGSFKGRLRSLVYDKVLSQLSIDRQMQVSRLIRQIRTHLQRAVPKLRV